ncbi:hypothetical protein QM565_16070 [Geitlerinema splendidum]|nr:hypothetical protein [Geitlerinema splendidum]
MPRGGVRVSGEAVAWHAFRSRGMESVTETRYKPETGAAFTIRQGTQRPEH